jgi:hypothetical protein
MASVLAIVPRLAGFFPAEGDGFLRAIKIRSSPSFGGEVKPSVPCRKILRHVREPFKETSVWHIHHFPCSVPHAVLLDDCRIARELWLTNNEFTPADIIPP